MNPATHATRQQFGEYLRDQRREKGLEVADVAHATRIPARSLGLLEAGDFDALPADVFVRGFVRAYAGCVGIDADDAVARYAACGLAAAPVSHVTADGSAAVAVRPAPPTESASGAPADAAIAPGRGRRTFLPTDTPAESSGGHSRRGPLTLAVLVLAIVATLAMSYLLRHPDESGDGVTMTPPACGPMPQAPGLATPTTWNPRTPSSCGGSITATRT